VIHPPIDPDTATDGDFAAALDGTRKSAAGAYLKRCREKAGYSRRQVGELLAPWSDYALELTWTITEFEEGVPGDYSILVDRLARVRPFSFDLFHLARLCAGTCDPSLDPWKDI
jgi:hypothetical protein